MDLVSVMTALAFRAVSVAFMPSVSSAFWTAAFFLVGLFSAYFSLRLLARAFRGESPCASCPLKKKCGKATG